MVWANRGNASSRFTVRYFVASKFLRFAILVINITMDNNDNIITRRGRQYQYSEADDTWYPVPTQDQYDFQRFVVFLSSVILICFAVAVVFEHFGLGG